MSFDCIYLYVYGLFRSKMTHLQVNVLHTYIYKHIHICTYKLSFFSKILNSFRTPSDEISKFKYFTFQD
jgi:hypothetical protein